MCKRFCYALLTSCLLVAGVVNAQGTPGGDKKAEKVEIPKGEGTPADKHGEAIPHEGEHIAPAPTADCGDSVSYRTIYTTEWVRENYTENVTRYRHVTEKVPYTTYKYISVPETKTRTYTVYKRIPEYKTVTKNVVDHVWTTETKTVNKRVRRVITETKMVTKVVDRGHWETQCVPAGPSFRDRLRGLCGKKKNDCCDPCADSCEPVRMRTKRVWVSCKECVQCPVTCKRCVWECVPTTVCCKVCKPVCRQVTCKVCTYKCVPVTKTETYTCCTRKCVPQTCHRCVTKCVPYTECVTRCRMVAKCVAKRVPVCDTGYNGCGDISCCDSGYNDCCDSGKHGRGSRSGGLFGGRNDCGRDRGGLFSGGLFSGGLFGKNKGGDCCDTGFNAGFSGGCCH